MRSVLSSVQIVRLPTLGGNFLYLRNFREFSVAKATLESQMSVCPSVRQSQKPLSLSELPLLTVEPIDHLAYQPSGL